MNAAEIMRSYIIDMETYGLAEQAGMFCEYLGEYDLSAFEGTKFCYSEDGPYGVHFIWDKGDLRIQLSFKADKDDSTWYIINGKKRFKRAIGNDPEKACIEFIEVLDKMA